MAELFRYIEHAFVVPSAVSAIDVGRQSELQNGLRGDGGESVSPDEMRSNASEFIERHFSSPVADPSHLGRQYLAFGSELLSLTSPKLRDVEALVSKVFGSDASTLVASDPFVSDKALLDDVLVCVKITTAFDRVNAHNLVAMRQVIAFLDDLAAGKMTELTPEGIRATVRRPILIPSEFVKPLGVKPDRPQPAPSSDPEAEAAARQRAQLMVEEEHLKRAYDAIMSLRPNQFEFRSFSVKATPTTTPQDARRASSKRISAQGRKAATVADTASASPTFLAVPRAAIERLGIDVHNTLKKANIDVAGAPVPQVIAAIKSRWQEASRQLAPYRIPLPAKVFRLGVNVFAVQDFAPTTSPALDLAAPKEAS